MSKKKPYAEACDRNSLPILNALRSRLSANANVLEIGSGTGQHAVYFSREFPSVTWQPSDLASSSESIQIWVDDSGLGNILSPIELDVTSAEHWRLPEYDAVFSANTAHIMPVEAVVKMFEGVAGVLRDKGSFFLYGPFMYQGKHTSDSNEKFDRWLRDSEAHRGVRDVGWLQEVAAQSGLSLVEDVEMPANNRILVWQKPGY